MTKYWPESDQSRRNGRQKKSHETLILIMNNILFVWFAKGWTMKTPAIDDFEEIAGCTMTLDGEKITIESVAWLDGSLYLKAAEKIFVFKDAFIIRQGTEE